VAENDRWFGLRRHTAFPFLVRTSVMEGLEDSERGPRSIPRCIDQIIRS
jgi:hypothetical protein